MSDKLDDKPPSTPVAEQPSALPDCLRSFEGGPRTFFPEDFTRDNGMYLNAEQREAVRTLAVSNREVTIPGRLLLSIFCDLLNTEAALRGIEQDFGPFSYTDSAAKQLDDPAQGWEPGDPVYACTALVERDGVRYLCDIREPHTTHGSEAAEAIWTTPSAAPLSDDNAHLFAS